MKPREREPSKSAKPGKPAANGEARKTPPGPDPASVYRSALRSRVLDERLEGWHAQGLIGPYFPALEWGGVLAAAAAALGDADWVFPAAREARIALWRGLPIDHYLAQLLGRIPAGGLAFPAFPGAIADAARRVASVPGGPASHLPHAVGAAQAAKLSGGAGAVLALCSGAAVDEPDFHVAMNFAGVWRAPVVLAVRLEGPFEVAARAAAYGLEGAEVDGGDLTAVAAAVARSLRAGKPLLLGLLHPASEDGGLAALRRRLGNGSGPDDAALLAEAARWCDEGMAAARQAPRPEPGSIGAGVYAVPPAQLGEEVAEALGGGPAVFEEA